MGMFIFVRTLNFKHTSVLLFSMASPPGIAVGPWSLYGGLSINVRILVRLIARRYGKWKHLTRKP